VDHTCRVGIKNGVKTIREVVLLVWRVWGGKMSSFVDEERKDCVIDEGGKINFSLPN
jgi:hypothetical protein